MKDAERLAWSSEAGQPIADGEPLGRFVKLYAAAPRSDRLLRALPALCLVTLGGVFALSAARSSTPLLVVVFVLVSIAAALVVHPAMGSAAHVLLFERGLVLERGAVSFSSVDLLFHSLRTDLLGTPISTEITLVMRCGERITFSVSGDDDSDLHDRLSRAISMPRLSLARKALAAGRALHFGMLVLFDRKIVVGARAIGFADLVVLDATPTRLHLRARDESWCGVIRLESVPHPRLLLTLLEERVVVPRD